MTATTGGPLEPRQAELLSAFVDGEVAGTERAEAVALLTESIAARDEYASLHRAKEAVRRLPPVDPPEGFFEAMLATGTPRVGAAPPLWPGAAPPPPFAGPGSPTVPAPAGHAPSDPAPGSADELAARRATRTGRSRGPIAAAVAGIAAASVVLGGVVAPQAGVRPPLEMVAAAQDGALPTTGADQDFQTVRSADDLGGQSAPPEELTDGFELVETLVSSSGGGILAVYESDGEVQTVYRQEGTVDWSSLPEGVQTTVEGDETWEDRTAEGFERVVVERSGFVYTLVGDVDPDVLVGIGLEMPEAEATSDGVLDRLRRAARGLVDVF